MLFIYKLCKDNSISSYGVATILNIKRKQASRKLNNTCQFTINELYLLKEHFVKKQIVNDDFDIGTFLNDV